MARILPAHQSPEVYYKWTFQKDDSELRLVAFKRISLYCGIDSDVKVLLLVFEKDSLLALSLSRGIHVPISVMIGTFQNENR